jgi:hypothetical protein
MATSTPDHSIDLPTAARCGRRDRWPWLRGVVGAAVATAALVVVSVPSAGDASALGFGYGQIGGYERDGYEFSS